MKVIRRNLTRHGRYPNTTNHTTEEAMDDNVSMAVRQSHICIVELSGAEHGLFEAEFLRCSVEHFSFEGPKGGQSKG